MKLMILLFIFIFFVMLGIVYVELFFSLLQFVKEKIMVL